MIPSMYVDELEEDGSPEKKASKLSSVISDISELSNSPGVPSIILSRVSNTGRGFEQTPGESQSPTQNVKTLKLSYYGKKKVSTLSRLKSESSIATPQPVVGEYSKTSILANYTVILAEKIYEREQRKGYIEIYRLSLDNGRQVVLKCLEIDSRLRNKVEDVFREYYIAKTIGCITNNVIKHYNMKQISIKSRTRSEILMEHGGGALNDLSETLELDDIIKILYQLVTVLSIMESRGIAHFDIKPHNMVWDKGKQLLKVIDFGTSISYFNTPSKVANYMQEGDKEVVGYTAFYSAPEVLQHKRENGPISKIIPNKADIFCFGVTFIQLLLQAYDEDMYVDRDTDTSTHAKFVRKVQKKLSRIGNSPWTELILNCIKYSPEERPNFYELKKMFIEVLRNNGYTDMLEESIEIDNEKRAMECFNAGEYQAAIWYIDDLLKKWKSSEKEFQQRATIYKIKGECMMEVGRYQEAYETFQATINMYKELKTESWEKLSNMLGKVCTALGKYDEAICYFNEAIKVTREKEAGETKICGYESSIGVVYKDLGNYDEALNLQREAVNKYKKLCGDTNPKLVKLYNNLSLTYIALSQYSSAIETLTCALNLSTNDLTSAMIHSNLGRAYQEQQLTQQAANCHQFALDIWRKVYGLEHPKVAICYCNLGLLFKEMKKWDLTLEYFQKARNGCSNNDMERAKIYNNTAAAYMDMERYTCFIKEHEKVLLILKRSGRKFDKYIAKTLNYIGKGLYAQGKYSESITKFKEAHRILSEKYGEMYSGLCSTLMNLGCVYVKLEEYETAINEYFSKALIIAEKAFGSPHPKRAKLYINLGLAYLAWKRYDASLKFFEKAFNALPIKHEPKHISLISIHLSRGSLYKAMQDYPNALKEYYKALALITEIYGDEHQYFAVSYNNLASVYECIGDYAKAIEYYQQAIAIQKVVLGNSHPTLAKYYRNLCLFYMKTSQAEKAIELLQKAITDADLKGNYEDSHLVNNILYNSLAFIYSSTKDYKEALANCNSSINAMEKVGEGHHPYLITSYLHQGITYSLMKDYDEALKSYKKAEEVAIKSNYYPNEEMAKVYSCLGASCINAKDYGKAIEYYKKSCTILRKTGDNQEELADAVRKLGTLYYDKGLCKNALECFEEAVKIWLNIGGLPQIKECVELADYYIDLGKYEKAIKMYSVCKKKVKDLKDPLILKMYEGLGKAYYKYGQYEEALKYYHYAKKGCKDKSVQFEAMIGKIHFKLGAHQAAFNHFSKSLSACKETTSSDFIQIASLYNYIGLAYTLMGTLYKSKMSQYQKIAYIKHSYALKVLQSTTASMPYYQLAKTHYFLKEYDKAIENYKKAMDELVKGGNHPEKVPIFLNLAKAYLALEDLGNAEEYANKAERILEESLHPTLIKCWTMKAMVQLFRGNHDQALKNCNKAKKIAKATLSLDSAVFGDLYEELALIYAEMKDEEKKSKCLEKRKMAGKGDNIRLNKAYFYASKICEKLDLVLPQIMVCIQYTCNGIHRNVQTLFPCTKGKLKDSSCMLINQLQLYVQTALGRALALQVTLRIKHILHL
eukprot:TRINITY_DN514_c0_g1_i1.p1 TRINITY_DN514_c0_g1~~TRINITY_DN514_c0_g1_i1.p1  ORF type:complete len:1554 (+),score=182.64 TRINITY_DN514_c0_g1_i1:102-4763(+)